MIILFIEMQKELHQKIYSKDSVDFHQLYDIYQSITHNTPHFSKNQLAKLIADQDYKIIVSKLDKHVVGFGSAKTYKNEFAVLEYFGIHQDFRQRGVGERLFQHMIYRILITKKMPLLVKIEPINSNRFPRESIAKTHDFFEWCGCRKVCYLDLEYPVDPLNF